MLLHFAVAVFDTLCSITGTFCESHIDSTHHLSFHRFNSFTLRGTPLKEGLVCLPQLRWPVAPFPTKSRIMLVSGQQTKR